MIALRRFALWRSRRPTPAWYRRFAQSEVRSPVEKPWKSGSNIALNFPELKTPFCFVFSFTPRLDPPSRRWASAGPEHRTRGVTEGPTRFPAVGGAGAAEAPAVGAQTQQQRGPVLLPVPGSCQQIGSGSAVQLLVLLAVADVHT